VIEKHFVDLGACQNYPSAKIPVGVVNMMRILQPISGP